MRRARIGMRTIFVKMLQGRWAETHTLRFAPINKIRGGSSRDRTEAFDLKTLRRVVSPARKHAEVEHVAMLRFRPENHILGVKSALAKDRRLTPLAPMDAIGRNQYVKSLWPYSPDGLVTFCRRHAGAIIKEWTKIGRIPIFYISRQQDIVLLRAPKCG